MKKTLRNILSLISVFLLILVMMPSKTFVVHASGEEEEEEIETVMYGAVVSNSSAPNGYSGIYAIKQALYKKVEAYAGGNGPSLISSASTLTVAGINGSTSLNWAKSQASFKNVFKDGGLNAELANFSMNYKGDVTIELQNEVVVERLNFYYIIASSTTYTNAPTSMVMCSQLLCDHAKAIISSNMAITGSWQTAGKSGIMSYSEGNLTAVGFDKKINQVGTTRYSGFNVFDNMSGANKRHALTSGAFVVITMAIRNLAQPEGTNNDNVYYINSSLPSNMVFDVVTEDPAGSTKVHANIYLDARTNKADSYYNEKNEAIGGAVDRFAALVHTVPTGTNDEGMQALLEQFDIYLKPIIEIGLGVLLVVRGTMLIVTIIKSSDEPDVRRESIKHLVTLFVTVCLIMVIIWFMKDIIEIIAEFIVGM